MNTPPNQTSGPLNPWPGSVVPQPPATPPNPRRHLWKFLVALIIAVAIGVPAIFYQSTIVDYLDARLVARPTAETSQIASQLNLTPRGTDIFYSSQPSLAASATNFPCKSNEENSVILGCYASTSAWFSAGKIYILNVTNTDLDGVVQVTAAHEMLHAAYARLNLFERPHVDQMVRDEYQKLKDDPTIKEQIAYYRLAEPGQDINELHSIIGTTVAKIDPELEAYYGRYFQDRAAVVAHYQAYFQALHKNDEQIKALKIKIDNESASLQQDTDRYDSDLQQLNLDIASFNQRASSGGFSSRSSFEASRSVLVARAANLNARAEELNNRVNLYNQDVELINSLSAQTEQLYTSLKGVSAPTTVGQ